MSRVETGDYKGLSSFLSKSEFLVEAAAHNLWRHDEVYGKEEGVTIFVPQGYARGTSTVRFEEMWYRHTVSGVNHVNPNSVRQLNTNAEIVYALCPVQSSSLAAFSTAQSCFGGVPLLNTNFFYNGCVFHLLESPLPDLRPLPGEIRKHIKICFLGYQMVSIRFHACGLKPEFEQSLTLVVSSTTEDRTLIASNQKMPWHGHGTEVSFEIPPVTKRTNMMLWFSLYDNQLRHPIIGTTIPACLLVVQPNVNLHSNPIIYDILPKVGEAHSEMWIRGRGFEKTSIRVMIGRNIAQVFHCDPLCIRCFIPPGSGNQFVWVANGNIYSRNDTEFSYIHKDSYAA